MSNACGITNNDEFINNLKKRNQCLHSSLILHYQAHFPLYLSRNWDTAFDPLRMITMQVCFGILKSLKITIFLT